MFLTIHLSRLSMISFMLLSDQPTNWSISGMSDRPRSVSVYSTGLCRFEWVMEVIPSVNIIDHIDKIIHISISSSSSFG